MTDIPSHFPMNMIITYYHECARYVDGFIPKTTKNT